MVRLTKIYTRTGDTGRTRLGDMSETDKFDLRVEAYGAVDELNAALGLAASEAGDDHPLTAELTRIQNDLFDLGADLCVPDKGEKLDWEPLRMTPGQTDWLETRIDAHNENLEPLDSFILPGGSPLIAQAHLVRSVCRRAERHYLGLAVQEEVNNQSAIYLNRLSDLLFVVARSIARLQATEEVLWAPKPKPEA